MKLSEVELRKWVQQYNNDVTHFDEENIEYILSLVRVCDAEILPDEAGIIGYIISKDFDCKKKLSVVILYCKPEYRGKYLRYAMRRIEEIAKQEGADKISVGSSISGYKEEKFNHMLEYFGYKTNGYIKEI